MERKTYYFLVTVLIEEIYRFNAISLKIIIVFSLERENPILNTDENFGDSKQPTQSCKGMKLEDSQGTNFKTYCEAAGINTLWNRYKDRHTDQQNRIESTFTYTFNCYLMRVPRPFNVGKGSLFSRWCWENWISTFKRRQLDLYLTSCTKINSQWIQDLNVKLKTKQLLERNIGKKLWH